MNTPLDTKAIRAVATTGSPGEWLVAAPSLLLTLCDELDEIRATLANERGEGEPPAPGWWWTVDGGYEGVWQSTETRDASGWPVAVRRCVPSRWTFDSGRTSHPTAREAMRAAMTAADKTRSPA